MDEETDMLFVSVTRGVSLGNTVLLVADADVFGLDVGVARKSQGSLRRPEIEKIIQSIPSALTYQAENKFARLLWKGMFFI